MQLVVVMAVRKAVSAATTTFTAISRIFFIIGMPKFEGIRIWLYRLKQKIVEAKDKGEAVWITIR